jgi:ABC-type dipeptide/oligopeptide/nickel transport system permease component
VQYGFDKPWFEQYLLWLGHLLQGNLGFSWTLDQSVASLLGQPATSRCGSPNRGVADAVTSETPT